MKHRILTFLSLLTLTVRAAETTLIDSGGRANWLYAPTDKPPMEKTYWQVGGVAPWAGEFDDVIVLGPSFQQGRPENTNRLTASSATTTNSTNTVAAPSLAGMPRTSYQMSGPAHEAKLRELIAEVGKTWKLRPKIFLHGFSAGAQFTHRFAFRNPQIVAGVTAHSGGSWANVAGDDRINPAAKSIPFVVSCGEEDKGTGGPRGTPTRIEGAKQFATNLESLGFTVDLKTWPGVAHTLATEAKAMGKALLAKVRAADHTTSITAKP